MRITLISDTHGHHELMKLAGGEILIHCGDIAEAFTRDVSDIEALDNWFERQNFELILVTGGNHDFALEREIKLGNNPFRHAVYLQDKGFNYRGVNFYAAPWTPFLSGFAFYQDDAGMMEKWALIPDDTDVLITHTPPFGILDRPRGFKRGVGCPHLRARVQLLRPKVHCFGHVHAEYGELTVDGTHFVNAAVVQDVYERLKPPMIIDL